MKQTTSKSFAARIAVFTISFLLFLATVVLFCSFKTARLADDFLKQLGITKESANEKITSGLLNGYVSVYAAKNAKNIALSDRKAVMLDLLTYTKQQVGGAAFAKRYNDLRLQHKPTENIAPTPEQDRATTIAAAKDAVAKMEEAQKKSQPQYKAMFDEAIKAAKESLKTVEDPNNKSLALYAKNYPGIVKDFKEDYARQLADWEKRYPSNSLLYIKMRLQEFLETTKDIDYAAALTTKNGKQYFVNQEYERKDSRWKMAFRAGKETVEPAREFVQKWMAEIK